VNRQGQICLAGQQLETLRQAFHAGSIRASEALAAWINRSSLVEIDSLELLALADATEILGSAEVPMCFCAVRMTGLLTGDLMLAFDDASGLALANMVLETPAENFDWNELAKSAVLETANILSCAFLNSLSTTLAVCDESAELMPTSPEFRRDYAESLLEPALMGQAIASDQVIIVKTSFEIDETPFKWTLLFLPDADSMWRLVEMLGRPLDVGEGPKQA
jgi:chemotaxis protein CheC